MAAFIAQAAAQLATQRSLEDRLLERRQLLVDRGLVQRSMHQLLDQFWGQIQAQPRLYLHFFLMSARHRGAFAVN
nr:hypothetical protein [Ralstonia pseudosolanacearum]